MLSVSNQTAVSEENPANASPVHTKMIEKINKINNLLNETISEYNLNNDVPQAYSALKRIEIDIRTLFDGLADHKFGEDEIRLVTNLCRKMNEDSVVQEIRYCYMEERLLEEEVRALPSVDNSKIANFTRERFSVGTSRKDSGQPESKNDEKTGDNEIKNETILKEVQIKSEEKEVVVKKVEIVEEEAKVEGSKLMEKIKERDNHEVEVQTKLESIELTTSVTVKMPKQDERKVDQEQMLELIAKMKEEFENFKLDEAYDFYTKFKNYPKTKKLPKADLIFHMEKLSEYKEMIGKIENNHKEAQAILKELQDEDGYILESVKKNFEIKYKIDGGLVSLKMEGVIDVPLFNMLALIYEMDAYDQWMPFCKETKQLKVVTTTSKAGWLKWSLPPPISNRETYVYGMGFNRLQVNGSVLIVARSIHNDLPLAQKIGVDIPETTKNTRIDLHYMGGSFTPISKDKIKMCLVTKFDPKIKFIPTSLINWVVRKAATFLLDILVKKATNFKGSLWEKRIQENREFYGWLETQINKYLNNQEANQQQGGK